ncbi:hypothetical protein F2Q69_00058431 [Brassica cretica]|uniref:Uncharacterized protein n=1 Tax=Brassica cretica TaxID=69181 RepID=A0A8S9RJT2_BRACR|nr:hypothetical protein F2Q69_00058431 [Brassica cretica]
MLSYPVKFLVLVRLAVEVVIVLGFVQHALTKAEATDVSELVWVVARFSLFER